MFFTYQRVGRIPVLPALAAAGAIVTVGGIAVTIPAIVGVVGCGTWLLRALGLVGTERAPASQGDDIIEGECSEPIISGHVGPMTTEEIDTDERHARLDWMRAEFRAAQQRRYEMSRPALIKKVRLSEPTPVPEAEPPALATPSP